MSPSSAGAGAGAGAAVAGLEHGRHSSGQDSQADYNSRQTGAQRLTLRCMHCFAAVNTGTADLN